MILAAALSAAFAKLPPPTPQEEAKLEKEKADKKAQTDRAKVELERAQDRVARRYHARHPGTRASEQAPLAKVKDTDLPSGAKEPDKPHGK